MKWIVEGANPATGRSLVREVEADTAAAAEKHANDRGMIVSNVRPAQPLKEPASEIAQRIEYASPATAEASPLGETPFYPGILEGAKLLNSSADSMNAFAVICWVLAAISALAPMIWALGPQGDSSRIFAGLVACVLLGAIGLFLRHRAIMSRLQAELAIAQRDLAINSFERPNPAQ